ncbi:hypothetical protein COCCADRAFT_8169 [Bipolaris zeicola 26-R-13]|uniref:Uncharacterized protein n=1 Tax=Cochliobolus carbonum (strain 26-R-13) TaxID=930089 RepID=W6XQJ7_COCC2|nr:uncharacterized protein COCCADRAFT_8169 [Bipolaris zeicola 26-R-13]EUC29667.1 hypothetical protein COCCADRAFT_8169 [Bipolaris zeicola 26-R-13]
MIPPIPSAVERILFILVLAISITNIVLGFASKNKESALHNISGSSLPLITDILLAIWVLFGVLYTSITHRYTQSKPFRAATNLATALLMTAFFISYLKFDLSDWPIWGPLAMVLGVVARAGMEAIYSSADCDMVKGFWNSHAMTCLQRSRSVE